MKPIRLITVLLSLWLAGNAMAHGGEDHGDEPSAAVASVATDQAGLIAHETATDTLELLLKYPPLEKKVPGTWWLFLADPMTNRPIGNAKVELTFSQIADFKTTFAAVTGRPGVYQADVAFPQEGVLDAIVSISGSQVNDLLTIKGIVVKPAGSSAHSRAIPWLWVGLLGLGALSLIAIAVRLRKKRAITVGVIVAFGLSLGGASPLFAHGGEDHGDEESATPAVMTPNAGTPNTITLAKESQFLLGVETAVAKRETVKTAIQAFGKITHRATGEQDILAPSAGRLRLAASGKIPISGQSVKKGDVLGEIETIGTLSLRAPFDGVVAFADFHPGQWVEAGTVLFKVTDPSVVWVESRLFEKDIALLAPGAKATVSVESLPDRNFEGTILAIGKTFDETSRSIPIIVELQNPQGLLKVGQWAKVFLETSTSAEAIAVPKAAILMKEGVPVVFVKRSAEVFEGRSVQLMNEYADTVYLAAGVADGDKVVIKGNYQLLPFLKTLIPGGGR